MTNFIIDIPKRIWWFIVNKFKSNITKPPFIHYYFGVN